MNFNKITFISIPRTGSTSIRRQLRKLLPYRPVGDILIPPIGSIDRKRAVLVDFHSGHHDSQERNSELYADLGNEWKEFEFTCVRNPLDRLVSGYFHAKKRAGNCATKYDFKSFIMNREDILKSLSFAEYNHTFRLQTSFPIQNCKLVLRTETLSEKWKEFCEIIGVPYSPIRQRNKTVHDDYMKYWDDEMLQSIQEYLKPDFDFLGY